MTVTAISLYLREYFLRKNTNQNQQKIEMDTRQKSLQLLHAAELAESEVIASSKYASQKLEADFKDSLDKLLLQSEQSITQAQDELIKFMQDLQKRSNEFEIASIKVGEQRMNGLFERLENRLADFILSTEQKTTSSIELEIKAARQLIETYKDQQLKLIDENVIAMMEQTLNLVLGKKLSLKEQLDLVYEALERAKVEKFVV